MLEPKRVWKIVRGHAAKGAPFIFYGESAFLRCVGSPICMSRCWDICHVLGVLLLSTADKSGRIDLYVSQRHKVCRSAMVVMHKYFLAKAQRRKTNLAAAASYIEC